MLKTFKTEIKPNEDQKIKIHKTIGVARFVYNFYIAENKKTYEKDKSFLSAKYTGRPLASAYPSTVLSIDAESIEDISISQKSKYLQFGQVDSQHSTCIQSRRYKKFRTINSFSS